MVYLVEDKSQVLCGVAFLLVFGKFNSSRFSFCPPSVALEVEA